MAVKRKTPTKTNGDIAVPCKPNDYAVRVTEEVEALWIASDLYQHANLGGL